MNAVWNSYGQLCGCPEIFKKSCKFFCRELDIRVPQAMHTQIQRQIICFQNQFKSVCECAGTHRFSVWLAE